MAIDHLQRRSIRLLWLLWFGATLFHTPSCVFARIKQQPLSEQRERTGLAIRTSVRRSDFVLSKDEKKLVSQIASASEERTWPAARSIFTGYIGCAPPVYGAALHAAFRCREYKQGAKIFEECLAKCEQLNAPIFSSGLRIFAKRKDTGRVQQIWEDALGTCELDELLGSARLAAAADAGDVEAAADTLDKMNSSNLSIDVYHINSAMRACWGWGDQQHKVATYFFDLLPRFKLSPTVVSFTSLIGAYKTASLQAVVTAYEEMKSLQIAPDRTFVETYIFSLVPDRQPKRKHFVEDLHAQPIERLQATRDALSDFKQAGLPLPMVCKRVDEELARMGL